MKTTIQKWRDAIKEAQDSNTTLLSLRRTMVDEYQKTQLEFKTNLTLRDKFDVLKGFIEDMPNLDFSLSLERAKTLALINKDYQLAADIRLFQIKYKQTS